jgi:uncharacterized membrane protein (UPF0127 family)
MAKTKLIFNLTRARAVCVGELADNPLLRMRGLLGRSSLPAGEGVLITPAPAIHTAFMRFPIDAVFLDRNLQVLDIVETLPPWRMASRRRARAVLELAAGESARRGLHVGDHLGLQERHPVSDEEARPGAPRTACRDDAASGPVIWPDAADSAASGHLKAAPMRVLVISRDRHFRSVTSMLLSHRGCTVTTTGKVARVAETISRDGTDVVVIDAVDSSATAQTVAAVGAIAQPVGIVIVDETRVPPKDSPVLAKWGPFEDLFAAIQRAHHGRRSLSAR